jgi:hypothetical protein
VAGGGALMEGNGVVCSMMVGDSTLLHQEEGVRLANGRSCVSLNKRKRPLSRVAPAISLMFLLF